MSDQPSPFAELPRRPAWVALAAPVGGYVVGGALALLAARVLESTIGMTAITAALVMLLVSLGAVAACLWIAARSGGAEAWSLGLDRLDLPSAAAWTGLIALPAVALAWAALAGTDATTAVNIPAPLQPAGPEAAFGVPGPPIGFDASVVVSLIAFCVAPAIATELALRGLALPALSASIGRGGAAVVTALLTPAPFALLASSEQGGPITGAALLAGLGISFVYLRTADLYPGIATLALGLGLAFGLSLGWSTAGVATVAVASSALAVGSARALVSAWPAAFEERRFGASPARP